MKPRQLSTELPATATNLVVRAPWLTPPIVTCSAIGLTLPTGGAASAAYERAGERCARRAGRASGGQERKESFGSTRTVSVALLIALSWSMLAFVTECVK